MGQRNCSFAPEVEAVQECLEKGLSNPWLDRVESMALDFPLRYEEEEKKE